MVLQLLDEAALPLLLLCVPPVNFSASPMRQKQNGVVSHLHFVDSLPFLQTLGPHGDARLAVGETPALLAQTLRLEAGERSVVRDGHRLPRHHGWFPGEHRPRWKGKL